MINTDNITQILLESLAAGFIAPAFAMLFAVPKQYLIFIASGGMLTRFIRSFLLYSLNVEIVIATFAACAVISLIFIYVGPKLGVPRPLFTVASVIALIPGMDAYNALLSLISLVEITDIALFDSYVFTLMYSGVRCVAILLAIALGIAIPPLFFYNYRNRLR